MHDQIKKEKNRKQMYYQIKKDPTVEEKIHCFFQILLKKILN